ncbi:MAG: zf-TFIIB domain-containing protein [Planctomycetota bacterium]
MLIACPDCHRQYQAEGVSPGGRVHCRCGGVVSVSRVAPHDARMVHCSSCGANLAEGCNQCGYCGSGVTLADHKLGFACPECFARLRQDARYCAECGVAIEPEVLQAHAVSTDCPRCKGTMVLRTSDAGAFTECTDCGGLWLDEGSFQRAVVKRDETTLAAYVSMTAPREAASLDPAALARPDLNTERYIPCPVCAQFMNRKNFATCSGVVIDWCKGHGYWFDASELARILDFVKAGGMDRARTRELRVARGELERVRRQAAQTRSAGLGGGEASFPAVRWSSSSDSFDLFGLVVTLVRAWFNR